jgi:entericidin B
MKEKIVTVALFAALTTLAACNTVHGAGKDVSSAGNAVSNAAK